jgi:hypothetical protein
VTKLRMLVFLSVLILLPTTARAADDDGWWGWLERLSGPGKFFGGSYGFSVLCVPQGYTDTTPPDPQPRPAPGEPDPKPKVVVVHGELSPCLKKTPDALKRGLMPVQQLVMVRIGYFSSLSNERFPDAPGDTRPVHVLEIAATYTYRFHRSFEAGFGAGMLRFSGDGFSSFSRFEVSPAIVSFAPFAVASDHSWAQIVRLRLEETYISKGMTGADFGNTVTKFSTDAELNRRFGFLIDGLALRNAVRGK